MAENLQRLEELRFYRVNYISILCICISLFDYEITDADLNFLAFILLKDRKTNLPKQVLMKEFLTDNFYGEELKNAIYPIPEI